MSKHKTKGTPCKIDKHVGEQLRFRRSILGISQHTLAKKLDLTFQQVQKYERGINRISAGRLYNLAQILDVPVTYFYEGYDGEKAKPNAEPLTRLQCAVVKLIPRVPVEMQRSVVKLLKTMGA